jgi:hypothetical protein
MTSTTKAMSSKVRVDRGVSGMAAQYAGTVPPSPVAILGTMARVVFVLAILVAAALVVVAALLLFNAAR